MNAKELAALLHGRQAGLQLTIDEANIAKESGLIVLFGESDDNVYVAGASKNHYSAFGGVDFYFDGGGLIINRCGDDDCPYYFEKIKAGIKVRGEMKEGEENGVSDGLAVWRFTFDRDFPRETFTVYDNGEVFCEAVVFSVADLAAALRAAPVPIITGIKVTPVGATSNVVVNIEATGLFV